MRTMDLKEASALLKMHPQTVLQRSRSGDIPAAKPGKSWVYIDVDLFAWLRTQYTSTRQDVSGNKTGDKLTCYLKEKKPGTTNLRSVEKQYTDLLAPPIKKKPKK